VGEMLSSTSHKSILSLLAEYDDFLTDSLVDRVLSPEKSLERIYPY